ncbi:MAG: alanine racemase [Spirochaetes bacterium]|nr:alanine racemase [Spirochaetota bacterium]
MKGRSTWALVDLGKLIGNYREIRRLSPGARICAIVKADAYGHGAIAVARALEKAKVDFLAVAFIEEALDLRKEGIGTPILVLGTTDPENAEIVVAKGISQTVYTEELARALSEAAVRLGKRAKIHVKIDTGMHRQGIGYEEARRFAGVLAGLKGLSLEGAYSHFTESDSPDKSFSLLQIRRFEEALEAMRAAGTPPEIAHIANSAAILDLPEARFDMVRPGIILYGLSPGGEMTLPEGLKPVMSLRSRIANLRIVPRGDGLSYGRIFTAARDTRVGLLQLGYADGYWRTFSNRAKVLVGGKRVSVLGRVCMDQTLIDLTDIPGAGIGDEVILFGTPELPVGELSRIADTIDYEITCGISQRVPRIYEE